MDQLSIGVVVPTYRRRHLLPRVLRPLLEDDTVQEVVVVVDGYDDGSMELLESLRRSDPKLIPVWTENGGEFRARQAGLQLLSTSLALFLDDDVLAGPDLAAGHQRWHQARSDVVVVGYMPTVVQRTRSRGESPTYLYAREYERACDGFEADASHVLGRFWAGNFSLRTEDALRVGLVADEFAGVYHADQDFGLRCRSAGLHGVFDRSLFASHLHTRSLHQFIRDSRNQGAGRVRLAARHPDTVEGRTDDYLFSNMPGPLRTVAGTALGATALGLASRVCYGLSGAAGWWDGEEVSARLLRRCEQIRGARAEQLRLAEFDAIQLASRSAGG